METMSTQPSTRRLVQVGAIVGVVAAVCNAIVVAIASAADVSLKVDGKAIPVVAFPMWTFIGAVLGVLLARVLRDRQRFVIVTTVATALTLIPAIATPDDTATKLVLVGTHVLAAVLIIPALARELPVKNDPS
jgi:peptidoglycan/LPS O-acetylase OafA/YrhL